jgi:energy-coupling factor transporter ATP-binding protein EcfA2
MSDFDFQPYQDFILRHHEQQQTSYTPTDVLLPLQVGTLVKGEQQLEKDPEAPPEHQEERLSVLEGLCKYALGDKKEHVILAGRPGSGKSTALKQLRLALAAEGLVPVLVPLKSDKSVPEMIQGEFRRAKQKVSLDQIDDWLLADQLVLLLDGVNEIPTDDLRRGLVDFREQNGTVPMIFTTRDLAIGGDLGIKQRLEMKPLTELQMKKFVGQRLPVDGEKLLGQLGDRLKEIAETPLLLQMLCDVFGQTGQIPENKGELFRLFDREYDKFKGFPPVSEDSRRFKSEILQHLAFVMMTGDASKPTEFWLTIDRNFAEREIEKFLIDRVNDPAAKAKEWLEDLLEHHLLQVAIDGSQVEFHHQLFQEYYAAEKLLGMLQDSHPDIVENKRFQHFYLNYLKWTEPLRFLLGLLDNKTQVVRLVKLSLEVDWMLGAKLSGEAKPEFHSETITLLEELKVEEWLLCKLLIENGSEKAIPRLIQAFRNSDESIRCSALEALGRIGSEKAIPILIEAFNDHASVRCSAEEALRKIGSKKAVDELNKAQENSSPVYWTWKAVPTIIINPDKSKRSIPELLEDWNDSDSLVRSRSANLSVLQYDLENNPLDNHILPDLLKLLSTNSGKEAFRIIQLIQANCQFYNYEVLDSPPPPIESHPLGTLTFEGDLVMGDKVQGDKVVGDKYDIQNVGNLNTGHVNIAGNQIGETK